MGIVIVLNWQDCCENEGKILSSVTQKVLSKCQRCDDDDIADGSALQDGMSSAKNSTSLPELVIIKWGDWYKTLTTFWVQSNDRWHLLRALFVPASPPVAPDLPAGLREHPRLELQLGSRFPKESHAGRFQPSGCLPQNPKLGFLG